MKRNFTAFLRIASSVLALGLSVVCAPALAQITVGGAAGTSGNNPIAFGSVQVDTTKVMTITLTTDGTVTFAGVAGAGGGADTSTLTGTPFQILAADDGCAGKTPAAAGTCTIAVRYTPTTETSSATYFRVVTTAPANYPGVFVNLTGTGVSGGSSTVGVLNIAPASPFTISAAIGATPTQILTLSATGGDVSFSGMSVPVGWTMTNLCGPASTGSVRVGYNCIILLEPELPDNAGTYPYKVAIQASDGPHILDIALSVAETASSTQGTISISPTTLNFGALRPDENLDKTVTITAAGANVALTGISVPTGFSVAHSCGTLIPLGGSCTAAITFSPTKEVSYAGSAVINSSAQGAPHFVTLTGSGSASATQQSLLTISPSTLDFGTLRPGTKSTKSATITASGTNVALDDITTPTGFTVVHSCGSLIPAGGSCTASVTFAPTAKIPYNGSAVIEVTDSPHFITLKGSGGDSTSSGGTTGSVPIMVLDNALLDFGDVTASSSSQKTVSIANRGGATLTVTPTVSGTGFSVVSGGCVSGGAISLAAGGSCTFTVKFAPTSTGTKSGRIAFSGTGAEGIEISLTGVGTGSGSSSTSSGLRATSTNLAFGSVAVGGSSAKTLALSTAGGSRPVIASVVVPEGYVASHDCATAASSTCTLTLAFTPQAETTYQGLVVVSATDGSAVFVTVSGQGSSGAQLAARTRGSNVALDLTGLFSFAAGQAGSAGNLYVAVLYNDALYFFSGGRWTAYATGVEPPAYTSAASQSNEITILIGQDISALSGAVVFLAYGQNFDEVVSKHQYTPVYVVE